MEEPIKKLLEKIAEEYRLFAPQEIEDGFAIAELENLAAWRPSDRQPLFSFKKFFVPACETLMKYEGAKQEETANKEKIGLVGLNLLDLKYVLLYDLVFANDSNYQQRRQNIFIVAHNQVPPPEENFTHKEFGEEDLMNFSYDVFLVFGKDSQKDALFVAGSKKGKEVLERCNLEYKDLAWREAHQPQKLEEIPAKIQRRLMFPHNEKVWEELNERCLRCGKCTIACPTCFCFRLDDKPELEKGTGERQRCWDSCFFDEFHEVTGGNDFNPEIKNRIHFWYYHKFARIPKEFNMTGCVGCKRCHRVCPAGIDIQEVIKKILEIDEND